MMRRRIVQVVAATGAALDLQGGVVDAETVVQGVHGGVDEGVVVVLARPHQVRGQGDLVGA